MTLKRTLGRTKKTTGLLLAIIALVLLTVPDVIFGAGPPVCDVPPTPAFNTTFTLEAGQLLEFSVQASDPDVPAEVTQIAAGSSHTCALLDTGAVRCWGYARYGQLGYGNTDYTGAPAGDVDVGGRVTQIAAGGSHTCALLDTGAVRCWGDGSWGRLGYGNTTSIGDNETPATAGDVDVGGTVTQIAAGFRYTCALLDTGVVRCWGSGANGSLGYGNTTNIGDDETPASAGDVDVGGTVTRTAAGREHTCAVLDTGAVRCWGAGSAGRLGYGNTTNIGDNETPASAGDVDVGGAVTQITTGSSHTCGLLDTGTARCWGSGSDGKLGYGNGNTIGDNETPASAGDIDIADPGQAVTLGVVDLPAGAAFPLGDPANPVSATFTWLPADADVGSHAVSFTAQDNTGLSATPHAINIEVTPDITAPAVTVEQASGQGDPTNASPVNFTVTFNEDVTGFTDGDVTLGGTANATTAVVSGGPAVYNVAVSGMAVDGTVTVSLSAGVASDGVGNTSDASTSTDNTVTYETVAPNVTVEQASGQADPTNALPINFTVTFSEDVVGFTNADVTLGGTANAGTGFVSGGPASYNVAVSGMAGDGTVIISLSAGAASDAAGNVNEASTSIDNNVTYDTTTPRLAARDIVGTAVQGGEDTIDLTFSEAVQATDGVFSLNEFTSIESPNDTALTLTNATFSLSPDGTVLTITLDEDTDGASLTSDGIIAITPASDAIRDLARNAMSSAEVIGTAVIADPPAFDVPPTPPLDSTLTVEAGQLLEFTVQASDTDVQAVVTQIALSTSQTGADHTCALLDNGAVRCWGDGRQGQLGYGNTDTIGRHDTPASAGDVDVGGAVAQIAAGFSHTCGMLTTGAVRCWGNNFIGQLGYGNTDTIGDNETSASAGDLDVGGAVAQIAAGFSHTCGMLTTGAVRCWGTGGTGQLGYGNTNNIGDDETPASAGDVDVGGTVAQINAGGSHTCALLDIGAVRCWGGGSVGQLGYGNTRIIGDDETPASAGNVNVGGPVAQIAAGYAHTCALLVSGAVRCWGDGERGRLGYGNITSIGDDETPASAGDVDVGGTVTQITAGFEHTCALLDTGAVRCWGTGHNGRLGYGNINHIGDNETPASAGDVDVGGTVTRIAAGGFHTCALLDTGAVRCWGNNISGQLGYGNTNNVGDNETPASAGDVDIVDPRQVVTLGVSDLPAGADFASEDPANPVSATFTWVPADADVGSHAVSFTAQDTTGLTATPHTINIEVTPDTTPPMVTVEQASGQADPTNASPINFTVTFSEDVTGFTSGDVTLGGTANPATAVVSGGPASYNVAVSGMTHHGTVIVSLSAGVARDDAGYINEASTSIDNTVTYDATAPTLGVGDIVGTTVRGDGDTIVLIFSEAVEAADGTFSADEFTLIESPNGTALTLTNATFYLSPDGTVLTITLDEATDEASLTNGEIVTVTPASDAIKDLAGNALSSAEVIGTTATAGDPDINGDGIVNWADLRIVAAAVGTSVAPDPWG